MARRIEIVDITPLEGPPGPARDRADQALGAAAEEMGFLVLTGAPVERVTEPADLRTLLKLFSLPDPEKARLLNRRFAPEHENAYRGFFRHDRPDGSGRLHTEGFDMGPAEPGKAPADEVEELLLEPNVWPEAGLLPGWREAALAHHTRLEALGRLLMRSFGRYLGLGEGYFEPFFDGGPSTLRFLRAPGRPDLMPEDADEKFRDRIDGRLQRLATPSHKDSGVLTLLWQEGGLQAQDPDGAWVSAPRVERSLNINFGDCLEFWTGGRLSATPHRVVAVERERFSVPFFFEPRVDAVIAPVTGQPDGCPPVRYADHVYQKMLGFGTHGKVRDKAA